MYLHLLSEKVKAGIIINTNFSEGNAGVPTYVNHSYRCANLIKM